MLTTVGNSDNNHNHDRDHNHNNNLEDTEKIILLKPIGFSGFNNILLHIAKCMNDARKMERDLKAKGDLYTKGDQPINQFIN